MKTVYLLGDSIRFGFKQNYGYGKYVADKLEGRANVLQPNDNCRYTVYTFRCLRDWFANLGPDDVDIIHWNNGLWDVVDFDGEPLISPELYASTLVRIARELKRRFPNVKLIFALSTPIVEEAYKDPHFVRKNADIREYNRIARETLEPLGVQINDLYSVAEQFTVDDYVDRKTHFTVKASNILADCVIQALEKAGL